MTTTTRTMKYTLGRGELSLAAFYPSTQAPKGFLYVGNTPSFGYTAAVQETDHFNADHGVSELDQSLVTSVTRSGNFVTDDINFDNLSYNLLGTKVTNTQTAATAVVEPTFVGVSQGSYYQIGIAPATPVGVRNVTNVVVKVATVTKALNTDYTVDLARGLVYIVPGGGIAANASVDVTYDKVAGSFDQVISGNTPFEGSLMFLADNPTGPNVDYLMPWVRLTPNGEFNLKAENAIQQLPFSIKILKPAGKAAVYANGQAYGA